MIKLEDKAMILMKYFIEGQSKREIARRTGFSRNTVKKYIEEIDVLIEENKKRKVSGLRKQLRKKINIYDYFDEKGYDISYSKVCNNIREVYELRGKEAYIKQHYLPTKTLQFDYGELILALFTTRYEYIYKNRNKWIFLTLMPFN